MDLYTPLLFYWCFKYGLARSDAEDVSQEVLMRVNKGIHHFQKTEAANTFRGWLRIITQRIVIDHVRRRKLMPPTVFIENVPEPVDVIDSESPTNSELDAETQILYQRALDLLERDFSPTTVQAFLLSVINEVPVDVVAQQLGMSQNAVYIAKSRVLSRLKSDLAETD